VAVEGVGGVGTLTGVSAIATGVFHNVALMANGTVDTWGQSHIGQLGNGSTGQSATPVAVEGVGGVGTLQGVTAVAAGGYHSLALLANGTLVSWGTDADGELGDNDASTSTSCGCATAPVAVQGISDVVAIAAGQFSSYALKADGTLWAWGNDSNGELANGGTTDVALPQQVAAAGTKVTAIASGQYASHVLAIEAVAPTEVSPPVISGQAAIGQQVTASTGVWSGTRPLTYSYQWERCSSSCTSIAGAYTLTAADAGEGIRVVVTASNSVGSAVGPSFSAFLERPDDLDLTAASVARSLGIGLLLVVVLGFPAELFNRTVKKNRQEISGWSHRHARASRRPRRPLWPRCWGSPPPRRSPPRPSTCSSIPASPARLDRSPSRLGCSSVSSSSLPTSS